MPQTLASEVARKSLGAILERVEQPAGFSADEVQELLASCEMGALVLERFWQLAQRFLDRGMEGTALRFLLREFADVIEVGIQAFDAARLRVEAADIPPEERAAGVAALERSRRRAEERREQLSALLRWLESPAPPVVPESFRVAEVSGRPSTTWTWTASPPASSSAMRQRSTESSAWSTPTARAGRPFPERGGPPGSAPRLDGVFLL